METSVRIRKRNYIYTRHLPAGDVMKGPLWTLADTANIIIRYSLWGMEDVRKTGSTDKQWVVDEYGKELAKLIKPFFSTECTDNGHGISLHIKNHRVTHRLIRVHMSHHTCPNGEFVAEFPNNFKGLFINVEGWLGWTFTLAAEGDNKGSIITLHADGEITNDPCEITTQKWLSLNLVAKVDLTQHIAKQSSKHDPKKR